MLTVERIDDLSLTHLGNVGIDYENFARAIESAACAERDARIAELTEKVCILEQAVRYEADLCQQALESRAELEQQLAEARKDAERYLCLVRLFGVTKLPCLLEPVVGDYVADGKESLDAAIDAARAASKEQT